VGVGARDEAAVGHLWVGLLRDDLDRHGHGGRYPDVLASADALVGTDAGLHDPAATNLGWASETGIAYCTSLLASDDNLVLLARDGDKVVGHLIGRLGGPGSVHPIRVADLESIHVYPAHRGHGVGEQLMAAFLTWAAEKGAQRATVTPMPPTAVRSASMPAMASPSGPSRLTSTICHV
jgi:GNAT superfamily N-acetyltransferase